LVSLYSTVTYDVLGTSYVTSHKTRFIAVLPTSGTIGKTTGTEHTAGQNLAVKAQMSGGFVGILNRQKYVSLYSAKRYLLSPLHTPTGIIFA
jgi:acyl-coenzyme A synthetase/AMP-(fatty) acid ligase